MNSVSNMPMIEQAYERLRGDIEAGRFGAGDYLPSMRRMATNLNVHRDTVWRAMKRLERDRWVESAPNGRFRIHAEREQTTQRKLAVLFITEGRDCVVHQVFQRVYDTLRNEGPNANIEVALQLVTPGEAVSAAALAAADVVMVAGQACESLPPAPEAAPDSIPSQDRLGTPIIGIHTPRSAGLEHWVTSDHFRGGEMAARHLSDLGYKKVAVIAGEPAEGAELRHLGFRKGWIDAGQPSANLHVLTIPLSHYFSSNASGIDQMRELVRTRPEIEAFFAVSDGLALTMCELLEAAGRSVPNDVGVIGCEGRYEGMVRHPPLTTMRLEMEEIARAAMGKARLLANGNTEGAGGETFPPTLIPGGTLRIQLATDEHR